MEKAVAVLVFVQDVSSVDMTKSLNDAGDLFHMNEAESFSG